MRVFILYIEISAVAFAGCLVLVQLSNWRRLRRLSWYQPAGNLPRVSVLVPARNEESCIRDCLCSLLAQDYPNFEVIALDDQSTDRTPAILAELAAHAAPGEPQLRVLQGAELPDGWVGKHWACQQLADAADGELLLFTDADTRHGPQSLRHGAAALVAEGADLLTAVPFEETVTWTERLIIPVVPWAVFTFVPLLLAYRCRAAALSAAIGQYLLFRKSAYVQIGGHAAVRDDPVDDMALARRVKTAGLRWRLADATADVRCRMYRNAGQVFEGLSKNLFAAFGNRLLPFTAAWAWLGVVFLLPPGLMIAQLAGARLPALDTGLALLGLLFGLASWVLVYLRFGFPLARAVLYPLTVVLALCVAARSAALSRLGRATWKGRTLAQRPVRW